MDEKHITLALLYWDLRYFASGQGGTYMKEIANMGIC